MEMQESILEQISKVTELNDLKEYMQDSDVDEALAILIKLIATPHVPLNRLEPLIVQLQALSVKFNLRFASLAYIIRPEARSEDAKKKSIYKVFSEQLNLLVMALKNVNR